MSMTIKQIANKMKAKGLQRLRWYCEMCEKQCRDENGFKCHQSGESHLRQMALFRADPSVFMERFSKQFEEHFMEVMKRKGGMKVLANNVYQEVIADRTHVHMNSTKWETLGSFVQYLGRTGLCKVEQTERGFFVQYIDRDPRVLARQEELAKRAEAAQDAEERSAEIMAKTVADAQKAEAAARAALGMPEEEEEKPTEIRERKEEEKIVFSLNPTTHATDSATATTTNAASSSFPSAASAAAPTPAAAAKTPFTMSLAKPNAFNAFAAAAASSSSAAESKESVGSKRKTPASTLESLMMENERLKKAKATAEAAAEHATNAASTPAASSSSTSATAAPASSSSTGKRLDYWIQPNIVVRLLNKKLLDGALYKAKGLVVRVHDKYVAEIKVLSTYKESDSKLEGTVLKIDQDELETVLPSIGRDVLILNGTYRGEIAELLALNQEKYSASVRIVQGPLKGKEIDSIDYEDICKLE